MKIALSLACLFLILLGLGDLAPYRPNRSGRMHAVRGRETPRARRVVRR